MGLYNNTQLWESFREWLKKNHHESSIPQLMRYAQQYHEVLTLPSKASEIAVLPRDLRRLAMSAMANLSKFLGKYESWKYIVKNAGLKWEKRHSLEVVLDIMDNRLRDTKEWLLDAIEKLPKPYAVVLIFDALTGLRPSEACASCRLISDLSEQNKLETYLNKELMMLEHFRFKNIFLRGNKNAFISFITPELLDLVAKSKPRISYTQLIVRERDNGLPYRTKQLRKYHGTMLREHLPTEVIDLLHGRVGESIFLRYYYKPFLQDIRNKILKAIEPLQWELLYALDNANLKILS